MIYRFNTILIKIPAGLLAEIGKLSLEFKFKGPRIAKIILKGKKKRNKVGRLTLPNFKFIIKLYLFIEENPHVSGHVQVKSVLFKSRLYFQ